MKFNNKEFADFRRDFKHAMKALEEKHNVSIDMGSITYNEVKFTSKMEVISKEGVEEGTSGAQITWDADCSQFGLKAEHFGKRVKLNDGTPATIVGMKARSYKYPIIVEASNGKRYKMNSSSVKKQLI